MSSETVAFYDLEATEWDKPLSACAVTADGDLIYYTGADSWERLANDMIRIGGVWVAHYGGGYDHLLMLKYLGSIKTVILTGTKPVIIEMMNGIKLVDSYPSFAVPLAKMGEYVGRPKLVYDRARLESLTPQELKEYNLNDVLILRDCWYLADSVSADLGMVRKLTAGSAAKEALKVLEPETYRSLKSARVNIDTFAGIDGSIAVGGLTEVFQRGYFENINVFDIKSSYPSAWLMGDMPIGLRQVEKHRWQDAWCDELASVRVRVTRRATNRVSTIRRGDKGAGTFEAWTVADERRLMENDEHILDIKIIDAYEPESSITMGHTFVDELFRLKEQGVPFAKVWVNSLHGKAGENPLKRSLTSHLPQNIHHSRMPRKLPIGLWDYFTLASFGRIVDTCAPHVQPLVAAQIYGRARAKLISMLRDVQAAGYIVYYCDTDSIFTNATPAQMAQVLGNRYGKGLGCLDFEGGPFDGWILGKKLYYLQDKNNKVKTAAKGVNIKNMSKASFDLFSGPLLTSEGRRGLYAESDDGVDMRARIFAQAAVDSAIISTGGITPFLHGAARGQWKRNSLTREIRATAGGKTYDTNGVGYYTE